MNSERGKSITLKPCPRPPWVEYVAVLFTINPNKTLREILVYERVNILRLRHLIDFDLFSWECGVGEDGVRKKL